MSTSGLIQLWNENLTKSNEDVMLEINPKEARSDDEEVELTWRSGTSCRPVYRYLIMNMI